MVLTSNKSVIYDLLIIVCLWLIIVSICDLFYLCIGFSSLPSFNPYSLNCFLPVFIPMEIY